MLTIDIPGQLEHRLLVFSLFAHLVDLLDCSLLLLLADLGAYAIDSTAVSVVVAVSLPTASQILRQNWMTYWNAALESIIIVRTSYCLCLGCGRCDAPEFRHDQAVGLCRGGCDIDYFL